MESLSEFLRNAWGVASDLLTQAATFAVAHNPWGTTVVACCAALALAWAFAQVHDHDWAQAAGFAVLGSTVAVAAWFVHTGDVSPVDSLLVAGAAVAVAAAVVATVVQAVLVRLAIASRHATSRHAAVRANPARPVRATVRPSCATAPLPARRPRGVRVTRSCNGR